MTIRLALFVGSLAVVLSLASPVESQQEVTVGKVKEVRVTLEDCVRLALSRNSSIVQGKLTRDFEDSGVDVARNAFLPRLSTNWGISRAINGPREGQFIDESTGLLTTTVGESQTSGSQSIGGSLNMTVFDASDFAALSASKNGLRASEMDLENSQQNVVFQAKQSYFELLKSISLLEVQQEQLRVSEESLRRAETLNEIGSSPISEVFGARAALERDRVTLITRENDVEIDRLNLGFTLGLETNARIVPVEGDFAPDSLYVVPDDGESRATQHPSLLSDRYLMLEAKDNLRATQLGVRMPTLSMSARYSWDLGRDEDFRGVEDLFLKNYRYVVSVNVNLPVFNGLSTATSVRRQKILYLRSLEQYKQSRRQRSLDIQRSVLNIERLRRNIKASEAAVKAAEQEFRLQDEAYNFGAGTFLQRQTAQVNLFNQRSTLVRATYDLQIEKANHERLIGTGVDPNTLIDSVE